MDIASFARTIDHTNLKATATPADIKQLCEEAKIYDFASVCVNPCYVSLAAGLLQSIPVCTVVGFPLGSCTTSAKVFEAIQAMENGASEIDMVIQIGALKAGDYSFVSYDISEVVKAVHSKGNLVKVIIETCYLSSDEIQTAGKIVINSGADFVKTSTGFGSGGATAENVALLKSFIHDKIKIKAAGGIRNLQDALRMLDAGADRLGTSASVTIIEEFKNRFNREC